MNIILRSLLLTMVSFAGMYAISEQRFDMEAKVSAFIPTARVTREMFSDVMPYYEFEAAYLFCNRWQLWFNVGYLSDKGRAIETTCLGQDAESHNKTTFRVVPLTFGLKHFYPVGYAWNFYAGAGIVWSFLKERDHSPFVHNNISVQTPGGVAKLGLAYQCGESFFIDLFTEYVYQKFSPKRVYPEHFTVRNAFNVSGFKFGYGMGIAF